MPPIPPTVIDPAQFYHLIMMLSAIHKAILAVATIGTATGEAAESETSVTTCVDWAYAQLGS